MEVNLISRKEKKSLLYCSLFHSSVSTKNHLKINSRMRKFESSHVILLWVQIFTQEWMEERERAKKNPHLGWEDDTAKGENMMCDSRKERKILCKYCLRNMRKYCDVNFYSMIMFLLTFEMKILNFYDVKIEFRCCSGIFDFIQNS